MNKVVLVIAAHSDDEAIGCSGTIFRHISNGDAVHVLFMTDGEGSRDGKSKNIIDERKKTAEKACKYMNVDSVKFLNFPDNELDKISLLTIVKEIEQHILNIKPSVIYTHHYNDLNIDHQTTYKAVLTACRPQPSCSVKEIYSFEILSSTEWQINGDGPFEPNVFIEITDFIDKKKEILKIYEKEMRSEPHSRSIKNILGLNELRGNSVGVLFAESFKMVRLIK